ncbi:nuclear transcription factor Y subunit B-7-like [Cynara cardunculus var. scolymus]|uniref:Histone-fold n=1 Tax=Cynara cardunculus var. scolymus TaxID=59895 RepID=A0A103Y105_CYNCS|nr:nuclear transcription factor Y subunit B-7-like [Cynara cardunculus var. scolymus]KVI00530.1 Histone-fold [Cynara cardunculus var. scolymus]
MEDVKNGKRSPENPSSKNNNKEQDRFLPIANVGRIMKKVVPGNGKISKDAKETVQECVSEFISFVTGEASDKCQREKRKTINGDDIIWAITTLGFEEYVEPLKLYLVKYRQLEGDKVSNNVPKQQCIERQQQHSLPTYKNVYSSAAAASIMSQPPFATIFEQTFALPFSSNSIQSQLHRQQESIDSVGQW